MSESRYLSKIGTLCLIAAVSTRKLELSAGRAKKIKGISRRPASLQTGQLQRHEEALSGVRLVQPQEVAHDMVTFLTQKTRSNKGIFQRKQGEIPRHLLLPQRTAEGKLPLKCFPTELSLDEKQQLPYTVKRSTVPSPFSTDFASCG